MASEGCEILFQVEDIAFLGFAEVIRHLPFIRRMMKTLIAECRKRKPQAVVLVDYPGFNLRFASRLRKAPELRHIPVLYYISPQVWAWQASRVPKIARLMDRMAVIFDFEVPIYQKAGLKADFVGHPLLEVAKPSVSAEAFRSDLRLTKENQILALLPGSRLQEVRSLFPLFSRTYLSLKRDFPKLRALVGCSPALNTAVYQQLLRREGMDERSVLLLSGKTYDLLAHCDVALVASGTVTLEAAILGAPLVMAYRVSPLTYWMGRFLVKIPDIALVNVVVGKRIVPEFIQGAATPERLAAELAMLLKDPERRAALVAELGEVRKKLGAPGASARVANLLSEMIAGK